MDEQAQELVAASQPVVTATSSCACASWLPQAQRSPIEVEVGGAEGWVGGRCSRDGAERRRRQLRRPGCPAACACRLGCCTPRWRCMREQPHCHPCGGQQAAHWDHRCNPHTGPQCKHAPPDWARPAPAACGRHSQHHTQPGQTARRHRARRPRARRPTIPAAAWLRSARRAVGRGEGSSSPQAPRQARRRAHLEEGIADVVLVHVAHGAPRGCRALVELQGVGGWATPGPHEGAGQAGPHEQARHPCHQQRSAGQKGPPRHTCGSTHRAIAARLALHGRAGQAIPAAV